MSAARAVVFDLFITLTDWDAERHRRRLEGELAAAMGVDPVAFAALMRGTFTERAVGAFGDARSSVATLAARLGRELTAGQLDGVMALRYEHQRRMLTPRPGVLDVMRAVRARGLATGILTDCSSEVVDLWPSLPYAGVVDAVTFSCEVGVRKPDPAGYHDIAAKLGVAPPECVYVGDGGSGELTGAAAVGMAPVLLETPFGPDMRYDAESDWQGRSIPDLHDLVALLADVG